MKIGIDIRSAGGEKTGKGWYTFYMVQNLLKHDHTNDYILYTKAGIPGFEEFKNAEVKFMGGKGFFWHLNVAHDLKKNNVDYFFAPTSYIIPALVNRKVKTIVTVHDLVAFLFPETHNKKAVILEKFFLKKALKKAHKVITVSENTKKDLLEKFKISPEKVEVIYCSAAEDYKPLDKGNLKQFASETNLPTSFFLAVGTLEPRKNYLNLMKGFIEVNKRYPNTQLIIIGQPGWQYEEIHQFCHDNNLGKKVHFLGYLSGKSLLNLYNLAAALVFPSFYEGFGIPPLEAMRCGCPVIASKTSSLPEVVGNAALLVDPNSHLDIAGAMIKILKDETLCTKLHTEGLLQARKFSWEASAKKLMEIFN